MTIDLTDLEPLPAPHTTAVGRRLLAAAEQLFYHRGITAVGVDLLAESARTTKRTLYQRFGSKEGLIVAYLQQRSHRWQVFLLERMRTAAPQNVGAALDTLFAAAEAWARENPRGCAFVNAWAELGAHAEAVRTIRGEKAWMRAMLVRVTGSPRLAREVHLIYEGAQVARAVMEEEAAYREALEVATRLLERGQGFTSGAATA